MVQRCLDSLDGLFDIALPPRHATHLSTVEHVWAPVNHDSLVDYRPNSIAILAYTIRGKVKSARRRAIPIRIFSLIRAELLE